MNPYLKDSSREIAINARNQQKLVRIVSGFNKEEAFKREERKLFKELFAQKNPTPIKTAEATPMTTPNNQIEPEETLYTEAQYRHKLDSIAANKAHVRNQEMSKMEQDREIEEQIRLGHIEGVFKSQARRQMNREQDVMNKYQTRAIRSFHNQEEPFLHELIEENQRFNESHVPLSKRRSQRLFSPNKVERDFYEKAAIGDQISATQARNDMITRLNESIMIRYYHNMYDPAYDQEKIDSDMKYRRPMHADIQETKRDIENDLLSEGLANYEKGPTKKKPFSKRAYRRRKNVPRNITGEYFST